MIENRIQAFPLQRSGTISYRESGRGPAVMMLHGIGASSAAWLHQLESLAGFRAIAWDAPGYGESEPLPQDSPQPADYAGALRDFIERLLLKDVLLVANSLGALMAGAYARLHPERVRGMILISPAGGYGGDQKILQERLKALDELGPEGIADQRSPRLLGKKGNPQSLELIRWSQRRIRPDGYRQAAHCLANGSLVDDARRFRKPVLVVCGTEDVITPEAGCKAIAAAFPQSEYRPLPELGHCAQIEDPAGANAMIAGFRC